jgi:hypothetical protein
MEGYIEAMNLEVQRWLDSLEQSGEMDVTKEKLRLTQYLAGHALIGSRFAEELGDSFWKEYAAISAW